MVTRAYLDDRNIGNADTEKYLLDLLAFCKKIEPYVTFYKRVNHIKIQHTTF